LANEFDKIIVFIPQETRAIYTLKHHISCNQFQFLVYQNGVTFIILKEAIRLMADNLVSQQPVASCLLFEEVKI